MVLFFSKGFLSTVLLSLVYTFYINYSHTLPIWKHNFPIKYFQTILKVHYYHEEIDIDPPLLTAIFVSSP